MNEDEIRLRDAALVGDDGTVASLLALPTVNVNASSPGGGMVRGILNLAVL